MTDLTEQKVLNWERHGSTVFSGLAIVLMVWIGSSVVTMKEDIAVMKVKITNALEIRAVLSEVKEQHIQMFMHIENLDEKVKHLESEMDAKR